MSMREHLQKIDMKGNDAVVFMGYEGIVIDTKRGPMGEKRLVLVQFREYHERFTAFDYNAGVNRLYSYWLLEDELERI